MGKRPKSPRNGTAWPSATKNIDTYAQWENYFTNVALNLYKWENLPPTCDPRYLEMTLFNQGFCLFFQDPPTGKYLTLQCMIQGRWNVYNIPFERTAYASNNYSCPRDATNSVLIFNNFTHTNMYPIVRQYAQRVYEIERAIDVNVKAQKTPLLLKAAEKQRLSMRNFFEKMDGNEPYIFLNSDTSFGEVEVLNTQAPFVAPGLFQLKQFYINEFLTIMGIENSNQDKRAQMTANEIGANYGQVEISRYTGLQARRQACNQINRMFGLNISVNVSSQLETLVNRPFIGISETPTFPQISEPKDDVPSNMKPDESEEDTE